MTETTMPTKKDYSQVIALLPWCKKNAYFFYKKNAYAALELDDCISIAVLSLYAALDKYDPEKGSIKSYARFYIDGALLKYLALVTNHASKLNVNVVDDWNSLVFLEECESSLGGNSTLHKSCCAGEDIMLEYELVDVIKRLDSKQRVVIVLFYYESFSIKDISKILKVTPSRASQIHRDAINEIKKYL